MEVMMIEEKRQAELFMREASKLSELATRKALVEAGVVRAAQKDVDLSERVVYQQKEAAAQLHELLRMWLG